VAETLVGLIGGTGLGEALAEEAGAETVEVETPFGPPSAPVRMTEVAGRRVAVLARHGEGHRLNPSRVPYRANVFAMKSLGVTHIVASTACGSLSEAIAPRDLVVCDQVIDRTLRPGKTFFENLAVHVPLADPFCPALRGLLVQCGMEMDTTVHPSGTYVCMEGPQFSTRAESHLHRRWGADLVGMTAMPEAKLAREAEICYALLAVPTDYDCWKPHEPGENPDQILESILANVQAGTHAANRLMKAAVTHIEEAAGSGCGCGSALERAIWTDKAHIPAEAAERLKPILGKYVT